MKSNLKTIIMKAIISILAAILLSSSAMAPEQNHLIQGVVRDESGTAMPGVSVMEKGTANGTLTNMNGVY